MAEDTTPSPSRRVSLQGLDPEDALRALLAIDPTKGHDEDATEEDDPSNSEQNGDEASTT
jgi:hypothetical protein